MFFRALSSKIMLVFSYHQRFSMFWQFTFKNNCWTSFSFMIMRIFPYERPHVTTHHCAVPAALTPLLYLLNILPCSSLKTPRFSWKKSRCEKWSFMTCGVPSFSMLWSPSLNNLDLYSFSKTLQPPLEMLAKSSFLFQSFFPAGFLTSTCYFLGTNKFSSL